MSGMPALRTALDAAIERRVSVLYNISSCFAAAAVALILLSQVLIEHGPFAGDVKKEMLRPWMSYDRLMSYMLWAIFCWYCRRNLRLWMYRRLHFSQAKRNEDLPPLGPHYGATSFTHFALIALSIHWTYAYTMSCYIRSARWTADVIAYEPCDSLGVDTPAYGVCRSARIKLFYVQMTSLGFAAVPAAAHGLHFLFTIYSMYVAFRWMNKQLGTIRDACASRPEINVELEALERAELIEKGKNLVLSPLPKVRS